MKNYLLLLIAASAFIFTSCGDNNPPEPTKTELITNKNWKITAQSESDNGGAATDSYTNISSCNKDDIFIFGTDGKFTWDEGATKCDPADPQTVETGTWAFTNEEGKIVLTFVGDTDEFDIVELTSSRLVIKESSSFQGVNTVTTTTYTAQ
jgi:hypothetical protein